MEPHSDADTKGRCKRPGLVNLDKTTASAAVNDRNDGKGISNVDVVIVSRDIVHSSFRATPSVDIFVSRVLEESTSAM